MASSTYERRRANLARLTQEPGAKQALAIKLEMTPAQISHWLRAPGRIGARKIKEDSARQIENALGLTPGELDHDPAAPKPQPPRPLNRDLLARVNHAVVLALQRHAEKTGAHPSLDKMAGIVALAYAHAAEHGGTLDDAYVQELVALMG